MQFVICDMIWPFFLCFRSPSSSTNMISIITGMASRSMTPLHGCRPPASTITTTLNNRHAGLNGIKRQPYGSCRLPTYNKEHYIHHIYSQSWPYHITAHPCRTKLDASNFLAYFTWFGAFNKCRSNLRTRTTTLILALLITRCKLDLNYARRNRHPQSHLCNTSCMSSVEQVS